MCLLSKQFEGSLTVSLPAAIPGDGQAAGGALDTKQQVHKRLATLLRMCTRSDTRIARQTFMLTIGTLSCCKQICPLESCVVLWFVHNTCVWCAHVLAQAGNTQHVGSDTAQVISSASCSDAQYQNDLILGLRPSNPARSGAFELRVFRQLFRPRRGHALRY